MHWTRPLTSALWLSLVALWWLRPSLPVRPEPTPPPAERPQVTSEQLGQVASMLTAKPAPSPSALGMRIAAAARHHVEHSTRGFRQDCSGFVEAILTRAGIRAHGSVLDFHQKATAYGAVHHRPEPLPGDLVFFHNTYDRNRNGRQDDLYTHIGVVVDLEPDGTIVLAHHGSRRSLVRMNLQPDKVHLHKDETGKVVNSHLKRTYLAPFNWPLRLTSESWAGFATVGEAQSWSYKD